MIHAEFPLFIHERMMNMKARRFLMLLSAGALIWVGGIFAFSSLLSVFVYLGSEADLTLRSQFMCTLISLLFGSLFIGVVYLGFRLRAKANGMAQQGRTRRNAASCVRFMLKWIGAVFLISALLSALAYIADLSGWKQYLGALIFLLVIALFIGGVYLNLRGKAGKKATSSAEQAAISSCAKTSSPYAPPAAAASATKDTASAPEKSPLICAQSRDEIYIQWTGPDKKSRFANLSFSPARDECELLTGSVSNYLSFVRPDCLCLAQEQKADPEAFDRMISGKLAGDPLAGEIAEQLWDFIRTQTQRRMRGFTASTPLSGHPLPIEDPNASGPSLFEMQSRDLFRLFTPVPPYERQEGADTWIAADRRNDLPFLLITMTVKNGRYLRDYYHTKQRLSWDEVRALAAKSSDPKAANFLEADAQNWQRCRDMGRVRTHFEENRRIIEWDERIDLHHEVSCTYAEGRYELFVGGDHGPQDRTGFGTTETLDPAVYADRETFMQFAKGRFDQAAENIWLFIHIRELNRLKEERGVTDPPAQMWGFSCPSYPHDRHIELSRIGYPPHEYQLEALVKYKGHWFFHIEGAARSGWGHSDGGNSDSWLQDVTDENVEEYIRKYRAKKAK